MGVFEDTWSSWLQSEREARCLAEASPQPAPSWPPERINLIVYISRGLSISPTSQRSVPPVRWRGPKSDSARTPGRLPLD